MFAVGSVLAERFRVDGPPIGAGGTCEVWPATELATGRAVVVKRVHAALADPATIGAGANRAAGGIGMAGPSGVETIGVYGADAEWWLVAARAEGSPLDAADRLGSTAALAVALAVAEEVARYHRRGRVHGAVRPGRVFLGEAGARLGEPGFGLVARPGHDAPEVLGGAPARKPADVYGLGLVLYRALAGRAPYAGPTPFAVAAAQRAGPPRPPPGPLGLSLLATKLLDPDPAARPRDAAVVVAALRGLRADPTVPARLASAWVPAVRLGGPWSVTGIDPATSAPALLATGLRRGAARRLATRLQASGWSAAPARDAWGALDLLWIAAAVLVGGALLSVPGALAGLAASWSWRLGGVRSGLASALPRVTTPLPPVVSPPGAEEAVTAGLLLLAAAGVLAYSPWIAAGMVLAVVCLALWTLQRPLPAPDDDLAASRLRTLLLDARRRLEARALPLDDALGLEGELWELERAWQRGQVAVELAIVRAEQLRQRVDRGEPRA